MQMLILALFLAAGSALQIPIQHTDSLRIRLYKEGKLAEYIQQRNKRLASRDATAGTPIIDYEDMAYMIQITLGTPAQTFVTFIDSGSSNLWVPDVSCGGDSANVCGKYCKTVPYDSCVTFCDQSCCTMAKTDVAATTNPCSSKHRFNSSASSSFVKSSGSITISYQTGDVTMNLGQETFCLYNTTLCATNQPFGLATSIGADFGKQPEDGIIGLGWPALAVNSLIPPMFNLMNQGKLDQPLFTVYMAGIGPTSEINGGSLTVGGLDPTNCGTPTYIPLTSKTYWQFKMDGVSAGTYSQAPTNGWQAISSTASSLIGGPQTVIDQLATAVGAKFYEVFDSYFIDCDSEAADIVFTINGQQYHITPKNYVISVGPGPCLFSFFPMTGGGFYPSWMLGPPLIREYCQVHDMQNGRLGMAPVLPH